MSPNYNDCGSKMILFVQGGSAVEDIAKREVPIRRISIQGTAVILLGEKIRQNPLCCVRRNPNPEERTSQGDRWRPTGSPRIQICLTNNNLI